MWGCHRAREAYRTERLRPGVLEPDVRIGEQQDDVLPLIGHIVSLEAKHQVEPVEQIPDRLPMP